MKRDNEKRVLTAHCYREQVNGTLNRISDRRTSFQI